MKFNFKLNLKVSAFYLEKQKSFITKKKFFFGRTAKVHPKDGVSRLNFLEGFEFNERQNFQEKTWRWFFSKLDLRYRQPKQIFR